MMKVPKNKVHNLAEFIDNPAEEPAEPWATLPDDDDAGRDAPRPVAVWVRASEVKVEPVRWLWPGRVALGKLTIIAGHPDCGKSFISCDMAARVTTGAPWPDGGTPAPLGSVVILDTEDGQADTIRPRLDWCGADVGKVALMKAVREGDGPESGFNLSHHLPALEGLLDELGDCRLVVINPITAHLGGIDSHKQTDVRGVLAPLAALADRRGVAVVLVSHLAKGGSGNALSRVSGSGGFGAACRAAWGVIKDPRGSNADADPEVKARRMFVQLKNNLAPDPGGMAFTIAPLNDEPFGPARVSWEDGVVTETADRLFAAEFQHPDRAEGGGGDCKEWMENLMAAAGGWMKRAEVDAAGKEAGYSPKQLRTAREKVCQTPHTLRFQGPSWWGLIGAGEPPADAGKPQSCPNDAKDAPSPGRGTLGKSGATLGDDDAGESAPPTKREGRSPFGR